MLTTKEKREAEHKLTAEGLPLDTAERIVRLGSRLHKLAEASCNGDYPADDGRHVVDTCPLCESCWRPESMEVRPVTVLRQYLPARYTPAVEASIGDPKRLQLLKDGKDMICPDCGAELRVLMLMWDYIPKGFAVYLGGDPRGAVLVIGVPSKAYDDYERRGIVCG